MRNVAFLQEVWARRQEIDPAAVFGGVTITGGNAIYTTIPMIFTVQVEAIKMCAACSGYRELHSFAEDRRRKQARIAAVLLPWHACPACRQQAEEAFARLAAEPDWDDVYYQNPADPQRPLVSKAGRGES